MTYSVISVEERSNQRGGRMLSAIDLLAAKTFSTRQLSWLMHRISGGSSWVVGPNPGGGQDHHHECPDRHPPSNQVIHLACRDLTPKIV